ncbi:centromere protein Scm3-domain-containing protein [Aspergillus unguis]
MEAPLKRKRFSPSPSPDDETGEVDLQEARAQNDLRLKSIFEGIFEKYGRDFTDIGDEIDLKTGDILVNNGHISALERENDAGDWLSGFNPDLESASNEQPGGMNEEKDASAYLDGHTQGAEESDGPNTEDHSRRGVLSLLSQMRPDHERSPGGIDGDTDGASEAEDDRSSVDSLLDTALSIQRNHPREVGNGTPATEKANPQHESPNQSQVARNQRVDETVDPVWRVPEISATFTTPTLLNRSRPKRKINAVRSQSPPGSGSIWALPWTTKRKPDTVERKRQKDSPTKKQKKHYSSPPICDWSFAEAPDGSESDDPLQEDYEPSPTPKGSVYIREKRKTPFSASSNKDTCAYCKRTFSRNDYVSHLRAVLSNPADAVHDLVELKKHIATIAVDTVTGSASAEPLIHSPSIDTPASQPDSKGQESTNESTPSGHKRARTILGPEEAKLIIQLKQVQGMKWKDILGHLPQKKLANIQAWHHIHWNQRKANPPRLSGPWTKGELNKLEKLKDQPGLTWPGIRAEIPGRLFAEVEFKLLQLWAGDVALAGSPS